MVEPWIDPPLVSSDAVHRNALNVVWAIVLAMLVIGFCGCAQAAEIPEAQAVACILGEARGEGFIGMRAIASALRNRGTTQGVYGCNVKYPQSEIDYMDRKGILLSALKAWRESAHKDVVDGASFWGGKACDKRWLKTLRSKGYVRICEVKGTIFYRKGNKSKRQAI